MGKENKNLTLKRLSGCGKSIVVIRATLFVKVYVENVLILFMPKNDWFWKFNWMRGIGNCHGVGSLIKG